MPELYVIARPNGASKTTIASRVLPGFLSCREFVNADAIASALSPFRPETVARQAGRLMLQRIETLVADRQDFAFESTLASRSFAPFLQSCRAAGYHVHLIYIWLDNADLAVMRIAARVATGGHSIPEDVIRRRYQRSLQNFFKLYSQLGDSWLIFNNSANQDEVKVEVIAENNEALTIYQPAIWDRIRQESKEL